MFISNNVQSLPFLKFAKYSFPKIINISYESDKIRLILYTVKNPVVEKIDICTAIKYLIQCIHTMQLGKKSSAKMKDVNKIINCTEQKNDDLIASLTTTTGTK